MNTKQNCFNRVFAGIVVLASISVAGDSHTSTKPYHYPVQYILWSAVFYQRCLLPADIVGIEQQTYL